MPAGHLLIDSHDGIMHHSVVTRGEGRREWSGPRHVTDPREHFDIWPASIIKELPHSREFTLDDLVDPADARRPKQWVSQADSIFESTDLNEEYLDLNFELQEEFMK